MKKTLVIEYNKKKYQLVYNGKTITGICLNTLSHHIPYEVKMFAYNKFKIFIGL